MPKQKGLIKITGTVNGMSYYLLNGEYISRKAVGPSKERIHTDPAFANVKANTQEFGGASKLSKAIRTGFLQTAKQFQDPYMASRLTAVCRNIIQKGSGTLGQREANLFNLPQALMGFQLNKHQAFSQLYTAKPTLTSQNNRSLITITIPKSTNIHHKKCPKQATHFQLTAALSMVSNYQWQPECHAYKPVVPELYALGTIQQTVPLACKIDHANLKLQLQIPTANPIPTNGAITIWLGITYLKQQDSHFKPLQTHQAMQCIGVL